MIKSKKGKQRVKNPRTHHNKKKRKKKARHLHNSPHKNHQRKNNNNYQIKKVSQTVQTNQDRTSLQKSKVMRNKITNLKMPVQK